MIRGRGAWLDDGRVVFHAGKNLFVDQNEIGLDTFSSEFTYKKGQKLEADIIKPLSSQESSKIVSLLECIQFRNKLDSKLFAGWLALAPICGALEWRPHLWLTGPSGSGKSWVLSHIVRPVLGNCALYFQSVSTSAGIRQSLGCDALPVIFDEAEVEREADQKRMQEVIILARQASRESDGRIVKGTAGGAALTWHVRSCFLFASIGLGATQRADLSRITCLDLLPENQRREDRFSEAQVLQKETVRQKEWASAFRARSVSLAGVIAQNAELFKNAVLDHLGNQRDADQFGSLLAGAYSLHSTKVITQDKANEWCAAQDWSAFLSNESEKDEHKCLAVLLEANIMVNTLGAAPERVAVMELISRALEHNWFSDVAKTSRGVLERFGICVRREGVDIASAHEELAKIYRQTQFVGKWNEFLARIPGAKRIDSSKIMNISKRAVRLPLAMFAVVPED
jgi:putative DNA primase/helicase